MSSERLTVVTLTHDETRVDWLREACDTVHASMPEGGVHVMLHGAERDQFQRNRWNCYRLGDVVGIVDHDDRIVGRAIADCWDALQAHPEAGVAFTDEAEIDEEGRRLPRAPSRPVRRIDVAMHPRPLHHFALIRRQCLPTDDTLLELALAHGVGIDWLVRAWAALHHGAVHVPRIGYEWRRHPGQASTQWAALYESAIPALRAETLTWMRPDETANPFIPWHGPARAPEGTAG